MAYAAKEIFKTYQGEGYHTGRAAVFLRFAGCNLWTGREEDRPNAVCTFCDTDFVGTDGPGGGKFATAGALARRVAEIWKEPLPFPSEGPSDAMLHQASPAGSNSQPRSVSVPPFRDVAPFVVCTGGEPLLQLDLPLIEALHVAGFEIAVETNGTILAPEGIDWLCVSPKGGTPSRQQSGQELKLVWYQPEAPPDRFEDLDFDHFFLQPMDGPDLARRDGTAPPAPATPSPVE